MRIVYYLLPLLSLWDDVRGELITESMCVQSWVLRLKRPCSTLSPASEVSLDGVLLHGV